MIVTDITSKIKKTQKGTIFFADDFLDFGSSESVNRILSRLNASKILVRLAQGIYLYPKIDKELGILYPSTEEIAVAIAKRDKATIIPTGVYALNALGLSTQIPLKTVFLTNGAARIINIGKRTIRFKKTTPKNLATKGKISQLVIQALKTIGQDNLEADMLGKIQVVLQKEKPEIRLSDAKLAPAWINKILKNS